MLWSSLIDELQAWFTAHGLFQPSLVWVVGVSGGPDSTVLLRAMRALSDRQELAWKIHAAHFHHGLRGADADADAAFAAALAEQLGLAFHTERADVRARVAEKGGSTEEVAREQRYEFLERIALLTGSERVAVAHHADDNAETVLHRICRGTGLRGLAGISEVRPIRSSSRVLLVRPLLQQRRAVIETICRQQGFETCEDSSNATPEFTRGRIRNTIMPLLREQVNPNVDEALLRLAEQARWLGTYLQDASGRTFESLLVYEEPGRIVLNAAALTSKHRVIASEVVRRALNGLSADEQDLTFAHIEAVLKLAEDPASGKELHLPGPIVVRKLYDRLEFGPLQAAEPPRELAATFITCPGRTPLPALNATLLADVRPVDESKIAELRSAPHPNEEWLDYAQVRMPLLVRGRREGDRFRPLGAPGAKSLSDFLGDEKIDPQLRDATGILCDQVGPIWVMPHRIDERVKLRPDTNRALRLVLETRPQ